MSLTKKTILLVDEVISADFQPEENVKLTIGYAFNDLWCLILLKKPLKKGSYTIALSIERQRGEQRVLAIMRLKFTDLNSNETSAAKCCRMFRNVDITKGNYNLRRQVCRMFIHSKRIRVTGEVFLHLISNSEPVAPPQTLSTLSTDFRKMWCNNIFSDIILRCGSEVFTAHKIILATRCHVFDEILKKNVNGEVKIDVEDLAPHVLKAVLLFIYSGETDPLTFQSACDLLSAADKYRLNELKTLCANHIKSSFTVENVLDNFHMHDVAKTYALEFIAENQSEIERTKQWRNFKKEFPDLVLAIWHDSAEQCENMKQECLDTEVSHRSDQAPKNTEIVAIKQECPDN